MEGRGGVSPGSAALPSQRVGVQRARTESAQDAGGSAGYELDQEPKVLCLLKEGVWVRMEELVHKESL